MRSISNCTVDLNLLRIPADCDGPQSLVDPGGRFQLYADDGEFLEVFFRDIRSHLVASITEADYVFGSVAWLTCPRILSALAAKKGCSLIVQKEDFLRPDGSSRSDVRASYSQLVGVDRHRFNGIAGQLSVCGDPTVEPVRCLGNHNSSKAASFPRAHNKFAVFCRSVSAEEREEIDQPWIPYAAWTGSFNWSVAAGRSLENAIYLRSVQVADAYYQEFQQLLALSEPLDWESEWVAPEWRIGT